MRQTGNSDMSAYNTLADLQCHDSESAFREIYALHWEKMFSIAYHRLNNVQEAEDIVHDVFVSLWVNRKKAQIHSLENYLSVAVKNLVLTKIRKKVNERTYAASLSEAPPDESHIESSIHHKKALETIQHEIERLPEKCKLIFKCSRNEGMPVKQIAAHLSISPKTVENQLTKALKQLKLVTKTFSCFL
ncbi:MAG: RNA polymerase sigma-70 factor [Agriterribacter sp.]